MITAQDYATQAADSHWATQFEKRQENLEAKGTPRSVAAFLCNGADPGWPFMRGVSSWLHGQRRFLVLRGPSYKGKTLAACSAFLDHTFDYEWFAPTAQGQEPIIVRNRSWAYGRFVPAATFQGWSKAPFGDSGTRQREMLGEARSAPLLILDDLGTELADMRALLTDLVSYRTTAFTAESKMYPASPLRTIFTTNLSELELAELYGDRVLNRLRAEGEILESTR